MDMLALSGCTHGCSNEEAEELTKMRYSNPPNFSRVGFQSIVIKRLIESRYILVVRSWK
jgi:hypothetical protein